MSNKSSRLVVTHIFTHILEMLLTFSMDGYRCLNWLESLVSYMSFGKQLALKEPTVVPRVGLEPTRLAAPDFESGTSTNSITEASENVLEARV